MSFFSKASDFLRVQHPEGTVQPTVLSNHDIIPMGPKRRIWGIWSYVFYWSLSNVTISTWSGASSLLSLGLSVGETMGIIVIGNVLIAVLALLNAAPGGYFHIGYTISQRVVFGIRGSYLGMAMRTILSIVWFGSQAYLGSECLSCVFASWSKNYLYMKNTIPESVNMTSQQLIAFSIFQALSWPLLCIRPEKFNKLMIVSTIFTFFTLMGITIWSVKVNHGNGPLMASGYSANKLSVSAHAWAWIYGMSSWFGTLSSGVTNQSDFTRFSSKPWSSFWGTWFSVLVVGTMIPLMGLVSASALSQYYDQEFWQPNQIIMQWLFSDYSAKARAAAFFAGLILTISQLVFNTVGNGYAGGMDMAGIFPKYINIRRGSIITALLSWVVQPWDFYNTSSTFVTVMSAFPVFMVPIIAIIISDFWIIRKKNLKLSDLYTASPNGNYWYWRGFNLRSLAAWTIAFAPGLPGLINAANPSIKVNSGISNYYSGSTFFEFSIAFAVNTALAYIFPYKSPTETDGVDYFDAWTPEECAKLGIVPYSELSDYEKEIMVIDASPDGNTVSSLEGKAANDMVDICTSNRSSSN